MDFLGDPSNPGFPPAETSKPSGTVGSFALQLVTCFLLKSHFPANLEGIWMDVTSWIPASLVMKLPSNSFFEEDQFLL